ncbi:MAG: hypothetical protein LAO04_19640 [Acidobacteriia bacterium]|nr:hypothetical protein [Terriglobia bacterium]
MSTYDDLVVRLSTYLADLANLLDSSRRRFSSLAETDVSESAGLYVIYWEEPLETFYVGKANRRKSPSAWGQPDGLRFRIMKNHLAYKGNDNFVRYIKEEFRLASQPAARDYIRTHCSVHWLEVDDPERLFVLEHLAIAATRPRFNRG